MLFALDEYGHKVNIKDSIKGNKYFCACCHSEVIQKKGLVKTWHYSHKKNKDCDEWYEMSEWHKDWQSNFKDEHREVTIKNQYGKHRADVKVGNLVIEFQHSPLSSAEFQKRTDFYSKDNYLVWLFDVRDKDIERGFTKKEHKTQHFVWKWAYKFNDISVYENLKKFRICLQIADNLIVTLTWNRQGFKYIGGNCYDKEGFMNYLRNEYKKANKIY